MSATVTAGLKGQHILVSVTLGSQGRKGKQAEDVLGLGAGGQYNQVVTCTSSLGLQCGYNREHSEKLNDVI